MDSLEKRRHRAEIAAWLEGILEANPNLKPTNWSVKAGVTRATVGRALSDKHDNVLSVGTLYKLARAINVPPPLDLGRSVPGVPNQSTLAAIMRGLLSRLTPEQEWPEQTITAVAQALRYALTELAEEPASQVGPKEAERIGRMAARPNTNP